MNAPKTSTTQQSPRPTINGAVVGTELEIHYHRPEGGLVGPTITLAVHHRPASPDTLFVGVAVTCAGDRFDRKLGRDIAGGRATCVRPGAKGRYEIPRGDICDQRGQVSWTKLEPALAAVVEAYDGVYNHIDFAVLETFGVL